MKKIFSFLAVAMMALTMSAQQLPQGWYRLTPETSASDIDDAGSYMEVTQIAFDYHVVDLRFIVKNVGDDNFQYIQTFLDEDSRFAAEVDTAEISELTAQLNDYRTYYYITPVTPPVVPVTVDTTYSIYGTWNGIDGGYWADLYRTSPGVESFSSDTLVFHGGPIQFRGVIGTDTMLLTFMPQELPVLDEDGQTLNTMITAGDSIIFGYQTVIPMAPTYAVCIVGHEPEPLDTLYAYGNWNGEAESYLPLMESAEERGHYYSDPAVYDGGDIRMTAVNGDISLSELWDVAGIAVFDQDGNLLNTLLMAGDTVIAYYRATDGSASFKAILLGRPMPVDEDGIYCGHNWGGMGDITYEAMEYNQDVDMYVYVGPWGEGSVMIATNADGIGAVEYTLLTLKFMDVNLQDVEMPEVGAEVAFLYEPYIKSVVIMINSATGIEDVKADANVRKLMMNNRVVIVRDGKYFDMEGHELR